MDRSCCVCGHPGEALCSRCHVAAYCGLDCQRKDWKTHKAICGSLTQCSDGEVALQERVILGVEPTVPAVGAPPVTSSAELAGDADSCAPFQLRSISGTPGHPAEFDVVLTGDRSVENAQLIVNLLKDRGVCVVKAGADRSFQRALYLEATALWEANDFGEAKKGQPLTPGGDRIKYDVRDDKVLYMTSSWTESNVKKCKALKVLDGQLGDFGWGLNKLLEEQLGVTLKQRTPAMLACYAGDVVPGARYDFHVDNPYQTSMEVPDDKRRLTVVYYINDSAWDVHRQGGALQVLLSNPRKAPRTTAEAMQSPRLTVAPESDTMAVFFSHTMYHAVLPVVGSKRRFALSTWFTCP